MAKEGKGQGQNGKARESGENVWVRIWLYGSKFVGERRRLVLSVFSNVYHRFEVQFLRIWISKMKVLLLKMDSNQIIKLNDVSQKTEFKI